MFRNAVSYIFLLITLILLFSLAWDIVTYSTDILNRLLPGLIVIFVAVINWLLFRRLRSDKRFKFIFVIPVALLFIISGIMAGFTVASLYADYRLQGQTYTGEYNNCYKVWAARGLVLDERRITHHGTQNSIESIQRAFDKGAKGTEVDVHFDTDQGQFIVSHDRPYNLKNGALLTLETLFEKTQAANAYFWLDFKKVRELDDRQLALSVSELTRLTSKQNLKSRIYVEGEAPFSLAAYRDAGFHTIFDTHPVAESNPLSSTVINLYKIFFYFGEFSVMGMNYGEVNDPIYGLNTRQSLGNIPVFLYHVDDDPEVLTGLSSLSAVRVLLVENHTLNRYQVNACPANS